MCSFKLTLSNFLSLHSSQVLRLSWPNCCKVSLESVVVLTMLGWYISILTNLSGLIAGYEPTVGAHENTGPNYRKDVLQMSDMLT